MLDRIADRIGYDKTVHAVENKSRDQISRSAVIEKYLLKCNGITDDPFKAIKVEDAFLPSDSTIIVEVMNVPKGGQKPISLDMFVEAIKPGTEFEIRISSEDSVGMDKIDIRKVGVTIEDLFDASHEYYTGALGNEANEHYPIGTSADKKVQDALSEVLDEDSNRIPGASLIRIGRFSHLESMTYGDRAENENDPHHLCVPKLRNNRKIKKLEMKYGGTRNLVDGKYPLGAVVLKYDSRNN